MTQTTECNLYVIGDNATGKTTLINRLTDKEYINHELTERHLSINWIIQEEEESVKVHINEGAPDNMDFLNFFWKYNESESPIIILMSNNPRAGIISNYWLTVLKNISSDSIIFIVINKKERTFLDVSYLNHIKKQQPNIRNIFLFDNELIDNPREFERFRYILIGTILNKFTSRLNKVKDKINYNLLNKEKELDLGKSNLTSLNDIKELFENTHLETLILSNEWGEHDGIQWIRKLSKNKSRDNILSEIPEDIKRLKNLKVLICGGNWKNRRRNNIIRWDIEDISAISELKELSILNLSNNKISEVEKINNLKKVEKIYLNNNQIISLPHINGLVNLKEIYLSNNNINNIEFLRNLKAVNTIDLHSNKITDLSPIKNLISRLDIKETKWDTNTISISNNPLTFPPVELIPQGKYAVIAFLNQLEAELKINLQPFINRDIKLILVGNSNVGKSTLVYWLKNESINKKLTTTHWMSVDNWRTKYQNNQYTVRIFDFGGQEYYHDTHHLFFSNKTLYLILWEKDHNSFEEIEIEQKQFNQEIELVKIQNFPLEYWLDSINFHLKKKNKTESEKKIEKLLKDRDSEISQTSKLGDHWSKDITFQTEIIDESDDSNNILIVQNKVDSKQDKIFLNQESLKKNHPKIIDFLSISVYQENGLAHFKNLLFEAFESMPIIGEEHLGTWGEIKKNIENEKFNRPFKLNEFRDYCNNIIRKLPELYIHNQKMIDRVLFSYRDTQSFAQYLNDIGIILFYPENPNLNDKIFLNQEYILDSIYKILLDLNLTKGEFNNDKILKALNKESGDSEVDDIINLMFHFKIIFKHPVKKDTYIAPLYLPKEPPKIFKIFTPLFCKPTYRYKYKNFIHKSVILDFFHHYGSKTLRDTNKDDLYYYWKEGIIIREDSSNEIIMVQFHNGSKSNENASIDIFAINATETHTFLNKVIEDLDIINQDWDIVKFVTIDGENFIPLKVIEENEENENWIFQYNNQYLKLIDFKRYLRNPIKMKKIFISYSKQDIKLVNKFIEHLSALQLDGKVSHWYCSELVAGSEWDKEIQKHFDESDIICFMISPNFMKTKYIHDYEIDKAFKKKEQNPDFKIVPIILDFCRWTTVNNNLGNYTALPYTAKPVLDFANQNMAWYIIETCLRLMIDDNLQPEGENFYYNNQRLPSDILKIYERIVEGKADRNL